MSKQLHRSEVPLEETWNLEDIFPTKDDWEREFAEVDGLIESVTKFKGQTRGSPDILLQCLEAQENLMIRLSKVTSYASLHLSADGTNPEYQQMAGPSFISCHPA